MPERRARWVPAGWRPIQPGVYTEPLLWKSQLTHMTMLAISPFCPDPLYSCASGDFTMRPWWVSGVIWSVTLDHELQRGRSAARCWFGWSPVKASKLWSPVKQEVGEMEEQAIWNGVNGGRERGCTCPLSHKMQWAVEEYSICVETHFHTFLWWLLYGLLYE